MKHRRIAGFIVLIAFTSCATIRHGDLEPIFVSSDPAAAEASIRCNGIAAVSASTPATLTIPRVAQGCVLDVAKDGYGKHSIPLERGYSAAFWTNFVPASGIPASLGAAFGGADGLAVGLVIVGIVGALGFAADKMSGRGYGHDPDRVDVRLQKLP